MLNLKIVNLNGIDYIFNKLTGIFFHCDRVTKEEICNNLIEDDLKEILKENDFYSIDMLEMYPIVSQYCIWSDKKLIYYDLDMKINSYDINLSEFVFLNKSDGMTKIKDIINDSSIDYNEIVPFINFLLDINTQVIKLLNKKFEFKTLGSIFIYNNPKPFIHNQNNIVENIDYYKELQAEQVHNQFESTETTISYMFRRKNDILNNKSYGEKLIYNLGKKRGKPNDILEVGAGLGDVAVSILKYYNRQKLNYTIYDLSGSLLDYQREKINKVATSLHNISYYCINAEKININNKFDLIISNEVIGDFTSMKYKIFKNTDEYKQLSKELFNNYSDEDYVNTGAISFLKKIYNALKEDGQAFISEYSELDGKPQISNMMFDHKEISIDFILLKSISECFGFEVKLLPLMSFLDIDDCKILSQQSFYLLNYYNKIHKQMYSQHYIKNYTNGKIFNIKYTNISFYMKFFYVLLLKKQKIKYITN
ncbi:class I SAM-dependent methyltransferase [Clostridium akagii]|uniref:class I SAM-dependent methyltransferase n=1 Tax=Clostridium akagii TaxID=91623 RepID=UPI00047ACB42|nr:class I SAM-dependent methyltransferase [Clostridium akagii]